MKFIFIVLLSFFTSSLVHAGAVITYHGRILDQSGKTLESNSVTFKIQIYSPNPGKCLLYEETRTISMSDRDGVFVIPIGDGDGARSADDPNISVERVFTNDPGYQFNVTKFPKFNCNSGGHIYTPQVLDQRQLVVSFKDNNSAFGYQTLPKMDINFVPLAVSSYDSQNLGGVAASQYLKMDQVGNGPNQLLQLGPDGKLPAIDGSNLTGITAGTISNTANISTSGTISTTNNIQTTKDITSHRFFLFNNGGVGPEAVGFQASDAMPGGASYTVTMPTSVGTANQVLKVGSVTGSNAQLVWDNAAGGGGVSDVTATSPLVSSGGTSPNISLPAASTTTSGYLSAADWNAFNGKQAANTELTALAGLATLGLIQKTGPNTYTGLGVAAPLNITGLNIGMTQANTTTSGFLSSSDWNTFNDKQSSLGFTPLNPANNLSELSDMSVARSNLGLGNAATKNVGTIAGTVAAGDDSRLVAAIQNAGGTPSIESGADAAKPAFGTAGRLYFAIDTQKIYHDSGTAWNVIASAGSGSVSSVSSANSDIGVADGLTTPVLTLNSGTGPDQIVKLDGTGKMPAVDGGALSNITAVIDKITNAATKYFDYRPNNIACTSGQTLSYTPGTGWVCAAMPSGTVTGVTAVAPLSSTGGSSPQISIAQAGAGSSGYLSSGDWNTFNNGATGVIAAARMPALSGDVSSSAGSTTVTLNTVSVAKGGTGLTSLGTSHQFLSVNNAGSSIEYKTLVAGSGISLSPVDGTLTISTSGAGGGIQAAVTLVATQGADCSTIGQLATNASGDLLVCDDVPTQLDGSACSALGAGAFTVDEGGALYVCLN